MSTRFIITGFPRTRTGWLANLLNFGSSFCLHDGLKSSNFMQLLSEIEARHSYATLGNSDSGVPLLCEPSQFPEWKFVFVERDRKEAEESYYQFFQLHPYPQLGAPSREDVARVFGLAEERLAVFRGAIHDHLKITVGFKELDRVEAVECIWDFLVPEEPFNRDRWEVLNCLNINPESKKVSITWA